MNGQYGYKTNLGLDFTSTKRHKTLSYYTLNKTKLNKFTIVPYKITIHQPSEVNPIIWTSDLS